MGAFEVVKRLGLRLSDVEVSTKYDGSPVLKLGGCFMAGLGCLVAGLVVLLKRRDYRDQRRDYRDQDRQSSHSQEL